MPRNKTARVAVRFTTRQELAQVRKAAKSAGLSMNKFMVQAIASGVLSAERDKAAMEAIVAVESLDPKPEIEATRS